MISVKVETRQILSYIGHLNEYMDHSLLTPEELLNIDCDEAADTALVDGVAAGNLIDRVFPDEEFAVTVDRHKLSS
jgi:hypothetical protein